MARVKVHVLCQRPLAECDCVDDEDETAGAEDRSDEDDAA